MNFKRKIYISFTLLTCCLVVLFALDVAIGSVNIPVGDVIRSIFGGKGIDENTANIVLNFRLPKAIVALWAGMALSVSGLQMQTIFRNPLADPSVLGITSGASLGVALFLMGFSAVGSWGAIEFIRNIGTAMAAWIGAGVVLLLVLAVSARMRDIMSVLILGIMFGSAISAIVGVLQFFSSASTLKSYVIWNMGSLGGVSVNQLYLMSVIVFVGLIISLFSVKMLNVLQLGDNYARSMGLNVKRARNIIFVSTSLLAGTITAFCGPIGFIGIAVPHVARMLFKEADHRFLLPATMLLGANIMLLCDIVSQLAQVDGKQLPIYTITALLGIPIIILVIVRYQKSS